MSSDSRQLEQNRAMKHQSRRSPPLMAERQVLHDQIDAPLETLSHLDPPKTGRAQHRCILEADGILVLHGHHRQARQLGRIKNLVD
jgi:hypothetical protein